MASTGGETLTSTARREGAFTSVVTRLTTVVAVITASSLIAVGVDVVAVRFAAAGAPRASALVGAVVESTRIVGARVVGRVGSSRLFVGNETVLSGHSPGLGYGILNVNGARVNGAHRAQIDASTRGRRRIVSGSLLVLGLLRRVGGWLLRRMGVASWRHGRLGRSWEARLALGRSRSSRTLSSI